jgi:hypothetical protein
MSSKILSDGKILHSIDWNKAKNETEAKDKTHTIKDITYRRSDFPKLAEKLSVIRTDRHEDLVRPKNILPVRKKSPKKFSHCFHPFYTFPVSTKPICEDDHDMIGYLYIY